jgi:hypothetical protein
MNRFLSVFLVIVAVLATAPALAASAPIPVDLFTHHLSTAAIAAVITPGSFTLNEWLAHRRYSRAQWYRMPPADRPDVIGEGRMQRISAEADARWLRKQERKAGDAPQGAKEHHAA